MKQNRRQCPRELNKVEKLRPIGRGWNLRRGRHREITKRLNGNSLQVIVDQLNGTLRGWFEYFKHSSKRTFPPLDAWIRMRLRRIEQWRHKKRGNGKGKCHYRWTNDYFASFGLFTMTTARAVASQSPKGGH